MYRFSYQIKSQRKKFNVMCFEPSLTYVTHSKKATKGRGPTGQRIDSGLADVRIAGSGFVGLDL